MTPLAAISLSHPAVVHFPVALLIVSALVAALALLPFLKRWVTFAAFLLVLGAVGSLIAMRTGEADEERAEQSAAAEASLERHEEFAEATTQLAIAAALLAVVASFATAASSSRPRLVPVGFALRILTAALAIAAAGSVAKTGSEGGALVHQHGVRAAMDGASATGSAPATVEHEDEEDDD